MENRRITDNICDKYGAGVNISGPSGSARLVGCTITGNSAGIYDGGVLFQDTEDQGEIIDCVISNNSSPGAGGAIVCNGASAYANPKIVNCIISGNSQPGVHCYLNASPEITNCTIVGNTPTKGGGIYCQGDSDPVIANTIFSGNSGCAIYESDAEAGPIALNCLFWSNSGGDFRNYETGHHTGAAAIDTITGCLGNVDGDPKFVSTSDFYLGTGSAAIDTDADTGAPSTDIKGKSRPVDFPNAGADNTGKEYDIGAYEAYPPPARAGETWILY